MKLLIAHDRSICSDAALDDLGRAGLPHSADVLVLSVADVLLPPNGGSPEPSDPEWVVAAINNARTRCAQAVDEARTAALSASKRIQDEHPGWEVRAETAADSPAWAVIDKAREWKADLVLVGAHGHSGTGRLILGSVSQRVVADASCSVRVARGPTGKKDSPVRLIVGIDGSPDSDMALREVAARAWPAGSEIRLITVIDSVMSAALAFSSLDPATAGWLNKKNIDARALAKRMNKVAAETLSSGYAVSSLVREGNPKLILVREAKRWKADCIFVGAKGMRGIERFLIGSVSMAVAARASCSVEVVRSKLASISNKPNL
jgi:nucleotide-binding universal stress UspA family protein